MIDGVMDIALDKIQPNYRALYDQEEIERLANSIDNDGQQEPISLWFGGRDFRILDGEKRWRACRRLGLRHMKATTDWSRKSSLAQPT